MAMLSSWCDGWWTTGPHRPHTHTHTAQKPKSTRLLSITIGTTDRRIHLYNLLSEFLRENLNKDEVRWGKWRPDDVFFALAFLQEFWTAGNLSSLSLCLHDVCMYYSAYCSLFTVHPPSDEKIMIIIFFFWSLIILGQAIGSECILQSAISSSIHILFLKNINSTVESRLSVFILSL